MEKQVNKKRKIEEITKSQTEKHNENVKGCEIKGKRKAPKTADLQHK